MALEGYSLRTIAEFVGRPLGVTEWVVIDQKCIDQFADCTVAEALAMLVAG